MKTMTMLILSILLVVSEAQAGRVVMFFGDSRFVGATNSIPQLVDAMRSDFTVCNKSQNGRSTAEGIVAIPTALAECQATGDVTDVVIQLGVADFLEVAGTSEDVASRLFDIADIVFLSGATPWIVHEMPGPRDWGGFGFLDARKWTLDNVRAVSANPEYPQIPMRDALLLNFTAGGVTRPGHWYRTSSSDTYACSNDELHPTLLECRQQIFAPAISSYIP